MNGHNGFSADVSKLILNNAIDLPKNMFCITDNVLTPDREYYSFDPTTFTGNSKKVTLKYNVNNIAKPNDLGSIDEAQMGELTTAGNVFLFIIDKTSKTIVNAFSFNLANFNNLDTLINTGITHTFHSSDILSCTGTTSVCTNGNKAYHATGYNFDHKCYVYNGITIMDSVEI
jgi:hypothetical protein